jgi:hypothetical protein
MGTLHDPKTAFAPDTVIDAGFTVLPMRWIVERSTHGPSAGAGQ